MTARLETALSLARATQGHITVLIDTPVARFMALNSMGGNAMGGSYLAADAVCDAVARDDTYAEELATHLRREDVPFDIMRGEQEPVDALAEMSRLADVIVVSRDVDFGGQLAVSGKAPILALGDAALAVPVGVVAVAWHGSDEAAAALRGALPLLKTAGQVHVLDIGEASGDFPALDALRYLSRHGVKAELHVLERAGAVEATLEAAVARLGAGLLVMGAYGHSRLREFLVGGVTRYFLELKKGPALLLDH